MHFAWPQHFSDRTSIAGLCEISTQADSLRNPEPFCITFANEWFPNKDQNFQKDVGTSLLAWFGLIGGMHEKTPEDGSSGVSTGPVM
ncbi:hypothetical protein EOE18_04980 [Novosphingobium umbonatum]|uniref:Uncharacterized protein n=1 Tax=Novosphingobium umbonatum TaxID=1908524 RepID=A0A437N8I1_9SPHN|nr:hypothetical protein [Novosphingobium umbonatum]RVU06197.1 hypothetical protein EOE18_04980 [Novosphingobium umbonatum]